MTIGDIEGIEAGTNFESRRALHYAGIHMPLQAGIAGGASAGAQSIVLSGGYADDKDYSYEISGVFLPGGAVECKCAVCTTRAALQGSDLWTEDEHATRNPM